MIAKYIITPYSVLLCLVGVSLLFMGDEITEVADLPQSDIHTILIASLMFGFGLVNWHSKNLTVGGIYGRPLVIGNLAHCLIGSISFVKLAYKNPSALIVILACIYSVFALLFTYLMYIPPKPNNN
ncbi:hypothetical protein [Fulvivirga lutea]|uniref:Uncharacterized protein n=1 Tax=Fulvivirga lutea TaxID=2810512 RepID=A0A974WLQ4_9BACT|nr:hypothetical protein [Fulvivirga lutea]QSE98540.1 hypothetical protein JR347_05525 [Fulvivirga lutea]